MSKETMATPTVQIDNNHLRVTEWRFAPGAATGYHRHEHDYVVVPTRDGELKLIGPQGEVSFANCIRENPISAMRASNTMSSTTGRAR
jgi:hypothetical protein